MKIIYLEDISIIDSEHKFNAYFEKLPKYRQDKVLAIKNKKDKYLSLLAGKLLCGGLKVLGFSNYIDQIEVDENGKPYIPGNPIYFSISHSGTKAMVVFSDSIVGCDVQLMKKESLSLADKYFTEEEQKEIKASDNEVEAFYKLWTLKECFMKATGKGLTLPLKTIDTKDSEYMTKSYVVDKDYMASYIVKKDDYDEEKEKSLFR